MKPSTCWVWSWSTWLDSLRAAHGLQDSWEQAELAPDTLSYLATRLIGGQLSSIGGKQIGPLNPRTCCVAKRDRGDLSRAKCRSKPKSVSQGGPGCGARRSRAVLREKKGMLDLSSFLLLKKTAKQEVDLGEPSGLREGPVTIWPYGSSGFGFH